jgi:nucleotide-binding universal stress UspA family protein
MYSRILVAVDNSRASLLAMKEAVKLAKNQHAKLRIVYVVDEFIPVAEGIAINFKKYEIAQRKEGKIILSKMLGLALKANVSARSHLIEMQESSDLIPKKIMRDAKKWHADLIVIGTHGRRGLHRLLLGSIAEEIIRISHIPVHLIREQKKKGVL